MRFEFQGKRGKAAVNVTDPCTNNDPFLAPPSTTTLACDTSKYYSPRVASTDNLYVRAHFILRSYIQCL